MNVSLQYFCRYMSLDCFNRVCALCARLRDSPLLGQIREALLYGEQYYGSNSKNLHIMV